MKSVGILALVLVFVAGIAVNGSRAQPLSATSVAFEQCTSECQPAFRVLAQGEAELAGYGDVGAPAGAMAAAGEEIGESRAAAWIAVATFAFEIARYLLDRFLFDRYGGSRPLQTIVAETVFDPVK